MVSNARSAAWIGQPRSCAWPSLARIPNAGIRSWTRVRSWRKSCKPCRRCQTRPLASCPAPCRPWITAPPEPAMAEGQNRLTVSIDASGALTAVQAEQSMEPFLNQVVLQAVKSWTLQPAVQHGQLKDSKVDILLRYRNGRVSFTLAPPAA